MELLGSPGETRRGENASTRLVALQVGRLQREIPGRSVIASGRGTVSGLEIIALLRYLAILSLPCQGRCWQKTSAAAQRTCSAKYGTDSEQQLIIPF